MLPFLTDTLDTELRKTGDKVTYKTYPGVDHVGVVGAADTATRAFFKARLK